MTKSTKEFLLTLLNKMGVDPSQQEEIIKTLTNTLIVVTIGVLKDSIPEEKKQEFSDKLKTSNNWVETLMHEALVLGENEQIIKELNIQLDQKINEFIDLLIKECPADKKDAVNQYVNSFLT